jgi:uncharacterized protein involved in type VI secretion and phage assembly
MIGPILNAMRLQALRAGAEDMTSKLAIVTNYDPNTYSVHVKIQPEDIKTGSIPLASPWVGDGWGFFAAPSIGDLVVVHFLDGDLDAAFAELRFFTNDNRPVRVVSGEFLLQHKSGSLLHFKNDGTVDLTSDSDLTATVGGKLIANVTGDTTATLQGKLTANVTGDVSLTTNGNLTATANQATIDANTQINGDLVVSGSIKDQNGAKDTVQHIRDVYDSHVHPGVQTGGGSTAPTTQTL